MAWHAEQSLWESLQPPETISLRRAAAGWFLVTGAVLLLLWLTGPVTSTVLPQDTSAQVEAGQRVVQGQRLNLDFSAPPLGPFYVWLVALAIRLSGSASPLALHCLQGLAAAGLGSLLFLIALPRLRLAWALLLLAAAELLLITAAPLGHMVWREFGYARYYDAMCYVLLASLFVSILIPRRESTTAGRCLDVLLEALSLALLFSIKAWFAVGAVAAYGLIRCLWPRPGEKRFWGLLALVLFALLALALANLGGGWRPDLGFLAGDRGREVTPALILPGYLQFAHTWGAAGLAVLIALLFARQCAVPRPRLVQLGLFSLVAIGAFLLGTPPSARSLEAAFPFVGVVPLAVVLFAARTAQEKKTPVNRLGLYGALLIALFFLVQEPKNSLLSRAFMHLNVKSYTPAKSNAVPPTSSADDTASPP
jgi:hypothetical protein